DQFGQHRGFIKVTRDLTERREAAERLRQSEEAFRLTVSAVRDYAIFLLDSTGHVLTWNDGAERIKGYRASEIIGQHFSVFYPEEAKERVPAELVYACEHGRYEEEGWRVRKDGTQFWASVSITPVHDVDGSLRGFVKVTRDLTDRRK